VAHPALASTRRPEAQLIGVEYRGNDRGGHVAPYVVTNIEAAPWLFGGLGVTNGAAPEFRPLRNRVRHGGSGLPPDDGAGDREPGLGDGTILGQMAYYETPAGARVFAAGTLGFGGSDNPVATVLFQNLWQRLAVP
jgi:hypothetical protein